MDRRTFSAGLATALIAAPALARPARPGPTAALPARPGPAAALAGIERQAGGRLGAWVLDTGSGREFGWRGGERFGQCSTFKLSLAACVLAGIDAGRLNAAELLAYRQADLLPHSPVTGAHVAAGRMSIIALAEAAQTTSDNLAANLLLRRIGGSAALTAFWRALGDRTSRLDRTEPGLNFVPRGEVRDTVTPRGIAHTVARIVTGEVLRPASRARLTGWMIATDTGLARIRAGLPAGWRAGDKTGTGGRAGMDSLVNDIAVAWPPGRAPLVIAGFYQAPGTLPQIRPQDEGVLRRLGAVAAGWSADMPK